MNERCHLISQEIASLERRLRTTRESGLQEIINRKYRELEEALKEDRKAWEYERDSWEEEKDDFE